MNSKCFCPTHYAFPKKRVACFAFFVNNLLFTYLIKNKQKNSQKKQKNPTYVK